MTTISVSLLLFVYFVIIVTIVLHIGFYRFLFRKKAPQSPQVFLARLVIFMNAPLFLGVFGIAYFEKRGIPEGVLMFLFAFIVLNSAGYAYFHFFNMSETGRRVRMLIEIQSQTRIHLDQLKSVYSPEDMVSVRLKRLVETGQIVKGPNNHYQLSSDFLLRVALVFQKWRQWLGLGKKL